ncbi:trypsin-like peptidase domain-containing protein [Streptomyces sp. NPDC096097]|uniref:nSTAND1 domain-containing NTPase n=1 Tax=Streptomyces sp. NPDC096097 TaxID=3155546 RepID=UPI00331B4851
MTGPQTWEGVGPKALNAAVLRIRDLRGDPVGLGFLISPELALTCAHVVSAALGTPQDEEPPPASRIRVDLPLASAGAPDGAGVSASVERLLPPREAGGGDMALLRLDAPLAGAHPVRLIEAEQVWGHPVRAFGFPAGRPGGVWHSGVLREAQAYGWIQADLADGGYPVSRGFSGTPVWDENRVGVVGMIAVAESGRPPVSYLIPTAGILQAWPELRPLTLPPSPFRSLTAFRESDAPHFYGRQAESGELDLALAGEQWVAIVGASGSGKSSLALAGVVPRLRRSGASAVVVRPTHGSSPLAVLAAALLPLLEPELSETERLARISDLTGVLRRGGLADVVARVLDLSGSRRLLVVVDQFEELLALAPEAVDELADVLFADALPQPVRVLTTLRADFLETALAHPRLGAVIGRRVHALGPLGPERLREVVTAPVDAVPSVRYEAGLVDRILQDTGTEPGALPLLGFTLDLLWREQRGGLLTYQAYQDLGGVTGALSLHADQVWAEYVPEADAPVARRLFTQLIRVPVGSPAATRRLALRGDLDEEQWQVAQRLAATRLLMTGRSAEGGESVELTHEALIGGWEKLARWVESDRSFLVWRESLRHDMDRWERAERPSELLPTKVTLAGAGQWVPRRADDLSPGERAYLDAGRAHQRSRARRVRGTRSAVSLVVVVAVLLGSLFLLTRQESRRRDALATSRALTQAAQDVAATDPAQSVMLALAAYRTSPTQEARNQLLRQHLEYSDKSRVVSGLLGTVLSMQASFDGNVVLATSKNGRATLFTNVTTGRIRSAQVPSVGQVKFPLVSADGKRAGYVQEDGVAAWFPVHADREEPLGELHKLAPAPGAAIGTNKGLGPSMSVDGTLIVHRVLDHLVWWDLDSGAVARSTRAPADVPGGSTDDLWIGADNRTLLLRRHRAGTNNTALLAYDPATDATRVVGDGVDIIELSGDRTAAVACTEQADNATVSLLRVSDGTRQGEPYIEQDKRYRSGVCLPHAVDTDGTRVALWAHDSLRLIDLPQHKVLSTVPSTFTKGSSRLASADGRLSYITFQDSVIAYTELPVGESVLQVGQQILTHDGGRTISLLGDGSALQVRPAEPGANDRLIAEAPRRTPYRKPGSTDLMRLSKDGRLLADLEGPNVVSVLDPSTLRRLTTVTAAEPPAQDTTPSILGTGEEPDFQHFFDVAGNVLTVSGTMVQQWDARTGRELAHYDAKALLPTTGSAPKTNIGPYPAPNKVAVTVWGDPAVRIVDITTGTVTETVRTTEDVLAVQFDPSGRYFALMRRGSIVELWRRHPLRKEIGPLRSTSEDSDTPTVTRFRDGDGHFLIAADNAVRTYGIEERALVESYEFGPPPNPILSSVFGSGTRPYSFLGVSEDSTTVIYADPSGPGGVLSLDPGAWQRGLCKTIGNRTFTAEERRSLPVRVPAQPVCPAG